MGTKDRQNAIDHHKVEVGEIDTSAPFQSVKDAVSLFGEFSGEKPAIKKAKPHSAERVLAKETQLHLAQKELNKLKEQLKNAETTKVQALVELDKAKRTVEDLNERLHSVSESKESAVKAMEAAKAKQLEVAKVGDPAETDASWKQDLETAKQQYTTIIVELDAVKQEANKTRQDCDASLEGKVAAFKLADEAEQVAKANMERAAELSKEILAVQESIGQVKLASEQAHQEQAKVHAEKDVQRKAYKASLEESAKKLSALKEAFDPELTRNLEAQLAETESEIGAVQKEMENARASDLDSVKTVTLELDDAKESLHRVAEEESSLRNLIESLKRELENVKKEHSEMKEKEAETESIAGNLHVKLRKSKSELEACLAEELKARGSSHEMISTLQQLSVETETARREAEEMMKKAEELKKEAQATKSALEEAEKKLRVALKEAEEADEAEARALDQIKALAERTNAARASTSESGANITISAEEYEALSRKVQESETLAEMKVAAAVAQVEAVKASEHEALKRFEASQKEIEEMKAQTEAALKRAETAEAAKRAVEGELRKWRERDQKKAAEAAAAAAARILAAETEKAASQSSSPHHYNRIQKQQNQQPPPAQQGGGRKLEKEKSSVSKKALLPNISGIFSRKKNQVEGGSPSYLPGEKPV